MKWVGSGPRGTTGLPLPQEWKKAVPILLASDARAALRYLPLVMEQIPHLAQKSEQLEGHSGVAGGWQAWRPP